MSGGVDSSVAAKLLKDQGYELMGIFLHFWKDSGSSEAENKGCSMSALQDARRVCQKIGIPLYTLNFSEIFKKQVVDNFLDEYESGRTPNPCVRCNKLVKLGLLIDKAKELGFSHVASGHYARLEREFPISNFQFQNKIPALPAGRQFPNKNQKFKLLRGKDKTKDQSYFLWNLSQEQLKHLLFPLGNYTKTEVRRLARKFNLPVATKSESQEVCFIPEKSHNEFLKRNIKMKSGPILTLGGKKVGEHQGLPLYTVGQRRGIEIGGVGPFYAVRMDYKKNILYVIGERDDPVLFTRQFKIKNVSWISKKEPKIPSKCDVVIRYRHLPVKCEIKKQGERHLVNLENSQRAVTPGQSAVFYIKDEVIGGGIIA